MADKVRHWCVVGEQWAIPRLSVTWGMHFPDGDVLLWKDTIYQSATFAIYQLHDFLPVNPRWHPHPAMLLLYTIRLKINTPTFIKIESSATKKWWHMVTPEIHHRIHRIHVWYIYTNIGGILMVNVTIYSMHGSYGSSVAMNWTSGSQRHLGDHGSCTQQVGQTSVDVAG